MKKIMLLALPAFLFACGGAADTNEENENSAFVSEVMEDISKVQLDGENGIARFVELAQNSEVEALQFNKDNIEEAVEKMMAAEDAIVVVGDHTIVEIEDDEDCKQSGSWGACMPYGVGYVKRGGYEKVEDHINNIIGTPDSQERTLYFVN